MSNHGRAPLLVINCASRGSRTLTARSWKRRARYLARIINKHARGGAVGLVEWYADQQGDLLRLLDDRFEVAVTAGGRGLVYDATAWGTTPSTWRKALGARGTKLLATDTLYGRGKNRGGRLTVSVGHLSPEKTAAGTKSRKRETLRAVAFGKWFATATGGRWRPQVYLMDGNSRADGLRGDIVGEVMKRAGYRDLGLAAGVRTGYGRYNVLRVWASRGVRVLRARTIPTRGSDHAVTLIDIAW